jgi:heavy metal sensor kinase
MSLLQHLKSVRFTLTLWYSLLLLLAFGLFGGSVYLYLDHLMEEKLDQDLIDETDWIGQIVDIERMRLNGRTSLEALSGDIQDRITDHLATNPFNYIVVLTTTQGVILYESDNRVDKALTGVAVQSSELVIEPLNVPLQGMLRVATRRADPFVIRVAYPERAIRTVLRHLVSIFSLLVPVVLFVAFGGGWVMAGVILRPIDNITEMADRISAQNLSERIPERKTDDELGRLIATMNGMIARLQASFDQIKQFSLNVAHELKTPLTILKGESELALSKLSSSEETRELVSSYLEETIRMSRIVDDLLTLAKADAGQLSIERELVDVRALIRELYDDAALLSSGKELNIQLTKSDPALVVGDASRLRQLFRILITNAIQFTDPHGTIRIACEGTAPMVIVTVEDTGIGIPAGSLQKIFDRFYRVDQARTRAKGGSGLGLSLAKWIVESHGASISVESELGKGSRFVVRLPMASPQNPSA